MNKKYLTLHEAISEGRAEWANVKSIGVDCATWKKMIDNCPSLAEERWYFKRLLGLTWIFFIPRNHWRRWCLLAAFKSHRDAQVYMNTL
jgi:hypothetical protein